MTEENNPPTTEQLKEFEIKTILEDIERSGLPLDEVFLPKLSELNESFYGKANVAKFKVRREKVSNKLIDFKRRSSPSYLKLVRSYGVVPSNFTLEAAQYVEQAKAKRAPAPSVDDITSGLKGMRMNDFQDNGFGNGFKSTAPGSTAPGSTIPSIPSIATPPCSSFKIVKSPPALTPPRSITLSLTGSARSQTLTPFGSYFFPDTIEVLSDFSGRYKNNIWIFEEPKMVKYPVDPKGKKYKYLGYLLKRKVDPPDVALYSATIPTQEYLGHLVANGMIQANNIDRQYVLFRGPYVEACDRVGKNGLINIMFPADESKEAVQTAHASIKVASEDDDHPGPSWYYTLACFPPGIVFDNRVFSDHDSHINPFESMPNKVGVPALSNEEVLAFHCMWRVAIKGTGTLMDQDEKLGLAERMKKRREAYGN